MLEYPVLSINDWRKNVRLSKSLRNNRVVSVEDINSGHVAYLLGKGLNALVLCHQNWLRSPATVDYFLAQDYPVVSLHKGITGLQSAAEHDRLDVAKVSSIPIVITAAYRDIRVFSETLAMLSNVSYFDSEFLMEEALKNWRGRNQ